jgi:hypothetical protein
MTNIEIKSQGSNLCPFRRSAARRYDVTETLMTRRAPTFETHISPSRIERERRSPGAAIGTPTSAIGPIWFGQGESNRYSVTPRGGARYDVTSASEMKLFAAS